MLKSLNKILYIESLRNNLNIYCSKYIFHILTNSLLKFGNNNSYILLNIFYNNETNSNIKYYYINPNIIQMAKYA